MSEESKALVVQDKIVLLSNHTEAIEKFIEDTKELKIDGQDDKDGYKLVKENRQLATKTRTTIDKLRKEYKQPFLDAGRLIDAKAKELISQIEGHEKRLKQMEVAYDQEKERIKKAKEAEEAARVDGLKRELVEAGALWNPDSKCYYRGDLIISLDMLKEATGLKFKSWLKKIKAQYEIDKAAHEEKIAKESKSSPAPPPSSGGQRSLSNALDQASPPEEFIAPEAPATGDDKIVWESEQMKLFVIQQVGFDPKNAAMAHSIRMFLQDGVPSGMFAQKLQRLVRLSNQVEIKK